MGAPGRPVPYLGDRLDDLLDLLDRARAEQATRQISDPDGPYLALLGAIAGRGELDRSA